MGARDIILRRRAALMASAMAGLSVCAAAEPAQAEAPAETAAPLADHTAREGAQRLLDEGRREEALAMLFRVDEPSADNFLMRARLLREEGRYAAARTALTLAIPLVTDAHRRAMLERELDDLADRTAAIVIRTYPPDGSDVRVDGELVGQTPLPAPLFVMPGEHMIVVESGGLPPATRTIDVAGGAELELDMPLTEPHVCLSMMPPTYNRSRPHGGVGVAPDVLVNTARVGGAPLIGGSLTSFFGVGPESFAANIGAIGAVYGSARGTAALVAVRFETRFSPVQQLAISVGSDAGYLFMPDTPEPAELDGLPGPRTVSSFFVRPLVSLRFVFGPIEVGPRVGVTLSRSEQGLIGAFGATYVSTAMWISYTHLPDFWDESY